MDFVWVFYEKLERVGLALNPVDIIYTDTLLKVFLTFLLNILIEL